MRASCSCWPGRVYPASLWSRSVSSALVICSASPSTSTTTSADLTVALTWSVSTRLVQRCGPGMWSLFRMVTGTVPHGGPAQPLTNVVLSAPFTFAISWKVEDRQLVSRTCVELRPPAVASAAQLAPW